ncbi:hypothetical protein [Paenibacillus cremeus]|uniref:hypothetical protein n=1 Tax=Paenibacillus cremeus TaxID=2163881 RepID=UPI001644AFFD|nr:hypothetical protein [Paenibacillus cremeus]
MLLFGSLLYLLIGVLSAIYFLYNTKDEEFGANEVTASFIAIFFWPLYWLSRI